MCRYATPANVALPITPSGQSFMAAGGQSPMSTDRQSVLCVRVLSLTTYGCDDLSPTRTALVSRPAGSHLLRDSERLVSSIPQSEQVAVRRTYSVDEAAAILGISRTTAYECVKSNELPALRFRGRIVISAAVIDALLAGHAAR